jgi:hypothetical protein
MSEKFPDILESAQKLPDIETDPVRSPFDRPLPRGDKYEDIKVVEGKRPPKYEFTAHIRRFVIGSQDDQSVEYEALINRALSGDVIVRFEERTFTKEGDVVMIVSWLEPIKKTKPPEAKL